MITEKKEYMGCYCKKQRFLKCSDFRKFVFAGGGGIECMIVTLRKSSELEKPKCRSMGPFLSNQLTWWKEKRQEASLAWSVLRGTVLAASYHYFPFCSYGAICWAACCQEHGVKELKSLEWQHSGETAGHSREAHTILALRGISRPQPRSTYYLGFFYSHKKE